MLARIRAVVFLAMAVLLIAATCKGQMYRNEEYGIALPVLEGVFLCPNPKGVHDHGPMLLLGTVHPKSCGDLLLTYERARFINIFAAHNTVEYTKHPPGLLKSQCVPCGSAPRGLEVPGLPSAAGRADHPDGWTDIYVVTQAGTPDPLFDPSVPSINYSFWLHTNKKHLREDLSVFRIILKTVRVNPK